MRFCALVHYYQCSIASGLLPALVQCAGGNRASCLQRIAVVCCLTRHAFNSLRLEQLWLKNKFSQYIPYFSVRTARFRAYKNSFARFSIFFRPKLCDRLALRRIYFMKFFFDHNSYSFQTILCIAKMMDCNIYYIAFIKSSYPQLGKQPESAVNSNDIHFRWVSIITNDIDQISRLSPTNAITVFPITWDIANWFSANW